MSDVNVLRVQLGEQVFNLRASAVVCHDGQVLLHRAEGDQFWTMPGGKVQMGETGADTVQREMQEEIGVAVQVERLLYISEEFFDYNDSRYHEVGMYYAVKLPPDADLLDTTRTHEGEEDGTLQPMRLMFKWFALDTLDSLELPLFPAVLTEKLQHIQPTVEHILRHE
jgi:ADP-ribose pyrophosphatase YjhB (NUDIX family)